MNEVRKSTLITPHKSCSIDFFWKIVPDSSIPFSISPPECNDSVFHLYLYLDGNFNWKKKIWNHLSSRHKTYIVYYSVHASARTHTRKCGMDSFDGIMALNRSILATSQRYICARICTCFSCWIMDELINRYIINVLGYWSFFFVGFVLIRDRDEKFSLNYLTHRYNDNIMITSIQR